MIIWIANMAPLQAQSVKLSIIIRQMPAVCERAYNHPLHDCNLYKPA